MSERIRAASDDMGDDVAGVIDCPGGDCEGVVPIPKWGGAAACTECRVLVTVARTRAVSVPLVQGGAMTLTDFLLARIAEDEAMAREAIDPDRPGTHWHWVRTSDDVPVDDPASDPTDEFAYGLRTIEEFPTTSGVGDLPAFVVTGEYPSESLGHRHIARHDPARVLAECEAKRQIVGLVDEWESAGASFDPDYWAAPMDKVLEILALPYADHPDYREEWKP